MLRLSVDVFSVPRGRGAVPADAGNVTRPGRGISARSRHGRDSHARGGDHGAALRRVQRRTRLPTTVTQRGTSTQSATNCYM